MILYFSATGNCRYEANKIAELTGDNAISIRDINGELTLSEGEMLGIVTPVYFWGLPEYVDSFLKDIKINRADVSYIYCVSSYGTTPGKSAYFVNRILKKKGLSLSASFSVKTVDNYTVLFDVKDKEKNAILLREEEEQLLLIAEAVNQKKRSFYKSKLPVWFCRFARFFYKCARKTSKFELDENVCIGCGICEKNCPDGAIKLIDGKPTWQKKECTICFACIHSCPKFAITRGEKTKEHGQYRHP